MSYRKIELQSVQPINEQITPKQLEALFRVTTILRKAEDQNMQFLADAAASVGMAALTLVLAFKGEVKPALIAGGASVTALLLVRHDIRRVSRIMEPLFSSPPKTQ